MKVRVRLQRAFFARDSRFCLSSGSARRLRTALLTGSGDRRVREKEQNPDSRAEDARCNRTLSFILSLTGRGDRQFPLVKWNNPRATTERGLNTEKTGAI